MKTINSYFSKEKLLELNAKYNLQDEKNILIQIFTSILDIKKLKQMQNYIVAILPNATLLGMTTDGEILNTNVTIDETVISITIFEKSNIKSCFIEKEQLTDSQMGQEIAHNLVSPKTKLLFLFTDGLNTNGEEFVNGVDKIAPDVIIAGGLAADGATFTGTTIFTEKNIGQNGAIGVSVDSEVLTVENSYNFGWQSIGPKMTITSSHKNTVFEIDGKKAYDVYKYYLGNAAALKLPAIGIEFPLIVKKDGVNVARAIVGKNDDGSLVFAGNINEGESIQIGFGNIDEILRTSFNSNDLDDVNKIESVFVYSCMARRRFLQECASLELEGFVKNNLSVSGFFTNGEFFKNKKEKKNELLNQTMTVIALSEHTNNDKYKMESIKKNENCILNDHNNPENATMVALSHLVNITSQELEKSNIKLKENVDEKTKELEDKILELENATRTKSDFLANMSHEIRTPLNAIIGFIDILKQNEKDKQNKKYLNIVNTSSHSLLRIINDILDFSKIESGNLDIEEIEFDLKELVKEIGLLFFESAKVKDITIKIKLDKDMPHLIMGDPTRLKQIASNLISNAIKFTPDGGQVTFEAQYKPNHKCIRLAVEDSGIGIKKENLNKIFKSFSQEDTSTTRKFGGTGLGLTISYDLVRLMGGELQVNSELGKGSVFYFSLPLKISENLVSTKKTVLKHEDMNLYGHILLVEDNLPNQMFMKIVLKQLQLTFDLASDGLEAVEKFKENKYDTILMDENMPNMNGIEATKEIRKIENTREIVHTPIIALTANALKGDREKFLNAGMDEYLTKPVNKNTLFDKLSLFLEK